MIYCVTVSIFYVLVLGDLELDVNFQGFTCNCLVLLLFVPQLLGLHSDYTKSQILSFN